MIIVINNQLSFIRFRNAQAVRGEGGRGVPSIVQNEPNCRPFRPENADWAKNEPNLAGTPQGAKGFAGNKTEGPKRGEVCETKPISAFGGWKWGLGGKTKPNRANSRSGRTRLWGSAIVWRGRERELTRPASVRILAASCAMRRSLGGANESVSRGYWDRV